jgi:DNA polymerase-3 subunit delta
MAKGSSSYTDFNNLMQQLDKNQIAPVYLLHGEEYYFLEQLLQKIEDVVVDPATVSFNKHVKYGKETQASDIVNIARRFPMMADKQLVVLKEAQYCKSPDAILPYIENPLDSTVLVWYHPGKKLPMNRKLGIAMKKYAVIYNADSVPEREVTVVSKSYIERKGYDIEPRPLHLLAENSGFKFSTIVKELDKVFSNVESGNKIREDQIEKFVGINKEYNIFALQKALAKKQKSQVVEIISYFMANIHNNPIVMLNASLFNYFKKVAMLQSMDKKTDKEVMSSVGIPFFAIGEYREAARNYSGKKIVHVMECINDCDLKFKGINQTSKDPKLLFEETILKILGI